MCRSGDLSGCLGLSFFEVLACLVLASLWLVGGKHDDSNQVCQTWIDSRLALFRRAC